MIIAPSVLTADLSNLAVACKEAVDAGLDWLHLDIMDGRDCRFTSRHKTSTSDSGVEVSLDDDDDDVVDVEVGPVEDVGVEESGFEC